MVSKNNNYNSNIAVTESWLFISLTAIIFIAMGKYFSNFDSKSIRNSMWIYHLFYGAFLFFSLVLMTSDSSICGEYDPYMALINMILPYFLIYMVGFIMIEAFPGWLRGFSNTIGTSLMTLLGLRSHIVSNIMNSNNNNMNSNKNLQYIYNDPIPLFNELTLDTFEMDTEGNVKWEELLNDNSVFKSVIKSDLINNKNDLITLAKFILGKHLVSYFIWIIILGLITMFISVNNLLIDERCMTTNRDKAEFLKAFSNSIE